MARLNDYPNLTPDNPVDQKEFMRVVTRERTNDIKEFENLQNRFMAGRKVGKIPASSSDISPSDKLNDFNIIDDGGTVYYYTLVLVGANPTWGRIEVDTSW